MRDGSEAEATVTLPERVAEEAVGTGWGKGDQGHDGCGGGEEGDHHLTTRAMATAAAHWEEEDVKKQNQVFWPPKTPSER